MGRAFIAGVAGVAIFLATITAQGDEAEPGKQVAMSDEKADAKPAAKSEEETKTAKWAPAVEPKPLTENVKRALEWLVKTQLENGAWAQGEESGNMGTSQKDLKDAGNVADTCVATLALIRAGSTPSSGPHAQNVLKALDFLCSEVKKSDEKSLYITSIRGTRVQSKLGTYIDTFLAAMLLAEVRNQMPDDAWKERLFAALDKTMDKIEKNQKSDGTWDNRGWAPTLAQSMASKAINRVAQSGGQVDELVRGKAEGYARSQFETKGGKVTAKAAGSAGVALYSFAANLGAVQDSANTNAQMVEEVQRELATAETEKGRKEAKDKLDRYKANDDDLAAARQAVVKKLEDKQFIAGFGSNGGEEFLSYMNIGESLAVKADEAWKKWDQSMTKNLNHIQNKDGSWTGHHCITGRTFCTSAALLVLTVDRAPVPLSATIRRR